MGTSVKGLLKGLRYISQIFDEKEPEMQIGLPTDVKHVAHIGWDGPSAGNQTNTPSWMNEFKSSPPAQNSSDLVGSNGELDLSSANTQESGELNVQKANRAPKSKRQTSTESSSTLDSNSTRRNSEKGSRRQRPSCPSASGDSGPQDGSSRSSRRRRGSNPEAEPGSENAGPKQSNRRKSKGSSDGGESTTSSRSRDNNSLTDIPLPVLEAVEEEKG